MNIKRISRESFPDTLQITCNVKILKWMTDKQSEDFLAKKRSLSSDLSDKLTFLFGSHATLLNSEFKHKVWFLSYKDLEFAVFSTAEKGTSIEIMGYEYNQLIKTKRFNDIIAFLEELSELINS